MVNYPFFYLQAGGMSFFQPQNKYTRSHYVFHNERISIQVQGRPEIRETILFLNGSNPLKTYDILKNVSSHFIHILSDINQRSNNV